MNQWQPALCPVSAEVNDGLPSCHVLTICPAIEALTEIYGFGSQNKSHVTNRYIADPGATLLPASTLDCPRRGAGSRSQKKGYYLLLCSDFIHAFSSFFFFSFKSKLKPLFSVHSLGLPSLPGMETGV